MYALKFPEAVEDEEKSERDSRGSILIRERDSCALPCNSRVRPTVAHGNALCNIWKHSDRGLLGGATRNVLLLTSSVHTAVGREPCLYITIALELTLEIPHDIEFVSEKTW